MLSKSLLARKDQLVSDGYKVVRTDDQSIYLIKRRYPRPWLNGLLTFFTSGLWGIAWTYQILKASDRIVLTSQSGKGVKEEVQPLGKFTLSKENSKNWGLTSSAYVFGVGFILIGSFMGSTYSSSSDPLSTATNADSVPGLAADDPLNPEFVPTFGSDQVPWLVGKNAKMAVEAFVSVYESGIEKVINLDTGEKLRRVNFDYSQSELKEYEGLFVCSQSVAPGADPSSFKWDYFEIEVSATCSGKQPEFLMGGAAKLAGQWVPAPLLGAYDEGDASLVEGVFVGYSDDYDGHKKIVVKTGFGEITAEFAFIDIAYDWCAPDFESEKLRQLAIEARDALFVEGMNLRLVKPEYLYGDSWFIHRLDEQGMPIDGEPPVGSVSELLVSTGYWVPDDYNVILRSKDYGQSIDTRSWKTRGAGYWEDDLVQYAKLIAKAANEAKKDPNKQLSACLAAKQDRVNKYNNTWGASNSDSDKDRRNTVIVGGGKSKDKKNKSKAEEYDYLLDDEYWEQRYRDLGDSYDSGGSFGTNCTWVNGYTRKDGTRVSGHRRCR